MVWVKIVQRTGVSACPKCGYSGFDLEPGEDVDDENPKVRCSQCGNICTSDQFMRRIEPEDEPKTRRPEK